MLGEVQDTALAEKPPSTGGEDSVGQCPPAAPLWGRDRQDDGLPAAPGSPVPCWEARRCQAGKSVIPQSVSLLPGPAQQWVAVSLLCWHRDRVGSWQAGRASL